MKVSYTGNDFYLQSDTYTVPLANYNPSFFEVSGFAAAVDYNTGMVVGANAPVQAGDVLELYANGLGPVTNASAVIDGQPGPRIAPGAYFHDAHGDYRWSQRARQFCRLGARNRGALPGEYRDVRRCAIWYAAGRAFDRRIEYPDVEVAGEIG